jgi:hypothetical protein
MIPQLFSFAIVDRSFQLGEGLIANPAQIDFVLDISTSTFSLVLFAITLYAWARRSRQTTLLIMSFGFLCFFIKQLVDVLSIAALNGELFRTVMDFAALSLFFFALVVKPFRKKTSRIEQPEQEPSLKQR